MNLKPLADNIVIKPKKKEEKTESGILLPDSAGESKPERGEVMATGPGKRDKDGERIKPEVKEGDEVIFTKYGPNEIKIDEEEYLIAKEEDILAIVEN
ncbi:MAG: co-chaperone GroES [Patescibacteria group bacterium]